MMRIPLLVALVASVWMWSLTCAQSETPIPAEALRGELDFIVRTIEEVHPDPYARISEEVFKEEVERVKTSLDRAMTSAQFYDLVAPLIDKLEDGHTGLVSRRTFGDSSCGEGGSPEFRTMRSVGVLSMPSFSAGGESMTHEEVQEDLEEYARFLEQAFQAFKEEEVEAVAIDLRENSGGNSQVGDMVVQYLTDAPYRTFSWVDVKVSEQSRAWLLRFNKSLRDDFNQPLGTVIREEVALTTPQPNPLRSEGDVYVLTSRCTASSAMRFASVVKDFNLGTVVGEETGGLPTNFGDSITSELPETGLELRVSYKTFVRPGGFDDGRGVLPDVEVPASQALGWVLSHAQ